MMAKNNRVPKGKVILSISYLLMFSVLLIVISGNLFWVEGWLFDIWFVSLYLGVLIYLYYKDPELLVERLRKPGTGGEKRGDKYLFYVFVFLFFLWFVIMPLDSERFMWTVNFPIWLKVLGGILLLPSAFFTYRAFADNPYASSVVRIQSERKQHVVSTGVYGFVRHPMYLGGILYLIGTPILLGSRYGILIGIIMSFLLAVRIIGEEKVLVEGLEGYVDYKKKVRYRLIPYVW